MTDPWDAAAARVQERRAKARRAEDEARRGEELRRAQEQAAADAAQQQMTAAVECAVPKLEAFMAERGAAAQRLLAARGDDVSIWFGGEREGGYYQAIFLCGQGLRDEGGTYGGYSVSPTSNRPATVREAVKAFAYQGPGRGKPDLVRNIVEWLTKQVNDYARS